MIYYVHIAAKCKESAFWQIEISKSGTGHDSGGHDSGGLDSGGHVSGSLDSGKSDWGGHDSGRVRNI